MWLLNTLLVLLNHGTAPVLACFSNSATTTKIIQGVADFVCDQNATRVEFEHLGAFSADYWKCMPETPEVLAPRLLYYDRRHSNQPIELEVCLCFIQFRSGRNNSEKTSKLFSFYPFLGLYKC